MDERVWNASQGRIAERVAPIAMHGIEVEAVRRIESMRITRRI